MEFEKLEKTLNRLYKENQLSIDAYTELMEFAEPKESLQLQQTDVMSRLQYKLNEYNIKKDIAKNICDNQKRFDVSFQAELEDEILLLAETEFKAVSDVVSYALCMLRENTPKH